LFQTKIASSKGLQTVRGRGRPSSAGSRRPSAPFERIVDAVEQGRPPQRDPGPNGGPAAELDGEIAEKLITTARDLVLKIVITPTGKDAEHPVGIQLHGTLATFLEPPPARSLPVCMKW
jgi:hypothetical protein